MRWSRSVSLALAAVAACAAVEEPAGPPPFEGVRRVALVRVREGGDARPKDPLDALKESLEARGYATRVVELAYRVPDELRPVARLQDRMASLAARARPRARGDRVERVGPEAGEAARALGVDAIALYHRPVDFGLLPPAEAPSPFPQAQGFPPAAPARRPLGALSLVDARGAAATFAWGAGEGLDADVSGPINAAEAIDALLRALSGAVDEEG